MVRGLRQPIRLRVIIGSEGWFSAYEKTASAQVWVWVRPRKPMCFGNGSGMRRETTARIRLAFLHELSADKVRSAFAPWHQFRPFDNDDQLNQLIRWVAGCLGIGNIELPTVRWPEQLEFRPNLADRLKEWPAIVGIACRPFARAHPAVRGSQRSREISSRPSGGSVRETLGVPVVQLDLKGGGLDIEGILGQFDLDLGQSLPKLFPGGGEQNRFVAQGYARSCGDPFWPFSTLTRVVSGTKPSWIG